MANKGRILVVYFKAWWGPAAASATWIPETSSMPWMSQRTHCLRPLRLLYGPSEKVPWSRSCRWRIQSCASQSFRCRSTQSSLTTGGTVGSNRYGEKPCGDAAAGAHTRVVRAQERSWQMTRVALNDCQGIEPPSSGISIVLSFTASPIHSKNSSLLPTTAIGRYPSPSNG